MSNEIILTETEDKRKRFVERCSGIVVDDKMSYEFALSIIFECKKKIKEVEAGLENDRLRTQETKIKAIEAWKGICNTIECNTEPYKEVIKRTDLKIREYLSKQKEIEEAQQKLIEKEAKQRAQSEPIDIDTVTIDVNPIIEKTTRSETGTASVRYELKVLEVSDFAVFMAEVAAGRVPAECVKIQLPKISKFVKQMGFDEFPGLKIQEVPITSYRGKI